MEQNSSYPTQSVITAFLIIALSLVSIPWAELLSTGPLNMDIGTKDATQMNSIQMWLNTYRRTWVQQKRKRFFFFFLTKGIIFN